MREKRDVLLQNVQRRRNRKRKWLQFIEYGLLGCGLFAVLAYCYCRMTSDSLCLARSSLDCEPLIFSVKLDCL